MEANLIRRKDALKRRLLAGNVQVEFTKADGTTRIMVCTLKKSVVPITEGKRKSNEEVQIVFDLEKSQWRSIRIDSIISYKRIQ